MRLLLDTHVLLWAAANTLATAAQELIDGADTVAVSAATIWEIEIKRTAGRLQAPGDVGVRALDEGYDALPIGFEHALAAGRLPPVHGDPFDRMLVAQAQVEGLTLATADAQLAGYDVQIVPIASAETQRR